VSPSVLFPIGNDQEHKKGRIHRGGDARSELDVSQGLRLPMCSRLEIIDDPEESGGMI
jgi:hypothetical protein